MDQSSTHPTSTTTRTCQPWCVRHDAELGLCVGETLTVPGSEYNPPFSVGISYEPGVGTVIAVGDIYMPLQEAKGLALALFRQIEQAAPLRLAVSA